MRAIDADSLIDLYKGSEGYSVPVGVIIANIEDAPTIDPKRKKGKWILVTDNNGQHYECDKCGEWKYHQSQKFCGECGTDMRGDQE